ncbi:unnamed protein product [Rodentolepis nana]|uniref:Uncharacterized protein n=1 Tax=Rodentolepis nana TaxID=102285 RepID=A0A3P7S573_RODNA|nr:unnamed protein product [Rodentolepis nana]
MESLGASLFISNKIRAPNPLNRVDPPERTMFSYSIRRKSMSDF